MNHLLAFVLCLAGFIALALATHRHQRDILRKSLPLVTTRVLRVVGTCALLFALGILVGWQGWGLGLVMFSGHTSIAAGLVLCVLIGRARGFSRTLRPR